jgi:ribosome-associated toxin RatA of RatAB toxin-antitoxin module
MPQVSKSVLVPYSAETMFALVDAVERYPEFLPWCSGTQVHSRDELQTVATINIRYAGVAQSFTTENEKEGVAWMRIQLRDGPFKTLRGAWHFRVLSAAACKVELELEYTFANNLLERAVGPVFGMIAETMMDRFVARAETLYGTNLSVVP